MGKYFRVARGCLALAPAQATSFDCAKAATTVEKLICGDADLSKLDEDMSLAYHQALDRIEQSNAQEAFKQKFIKSQRQWLKNERNLCRNPECLRESYGRRMKELKFSPAFGFLFVRPSPISVAPAQPGIPASGRN